MEQPPVGNSEYRAFGQKRILAWNGGETGPALTRYAMSTALPAIQHTAITYAAPSGSMPVRMAAEAIYPSRKMRFSRMALRDN